MRSVACFIFVVLAACSSEESSTRDDPYELARVVCREVINKYRAKKGIAPLFAWKKGERCADGEAKNDSNVGRAHASFPRCHESTQNECPGWPSTNLEATIASCLAAMHAEGPGGGHYENMMSGGAAVVACGFHKSASGEMWMLQNFR